MTKISFFILSSLGLLLIILRLVPENVDLRIGLSRFKLGVMDSHFCYGIIIE